MIQDHQVIREVLKPYRQTVLAMAVCVAAGCNRTDHQNSREVECSFWPDPQKASCAETKDGRIVLTHESLARVEFGPEGLSTIMVGKRSFYFVNREGKTAPAFPFDNGPDYFVEGLARTLKDGKVGFVNTNLEQVVAPVWDSASPFERGVSRVCLGCTTTTDGEHATTSGGKWGYVDRSGKIVVPVEFEGAGLPGVEAAAKLAGQ